MSAYCRVKYSKQFFAKFHVGNQKRTRDDEPVEEIDSVTGQLLTKVSFGIYAISFAKKYLIQVLQSLLSILKHRTVEKTVDRCELSIVEGKLPSSEDEQDEERDTLESMLIVRLHCKHGTPCNPSLPSYTPSL
jgi:cell cycle checkpoint control protein RAD9A